MCGERGASVTVLSCVGGNLGSLRNVLQRLGASATFTDDAAEVRRARRLLIPGVGAFDAAVGSLLQSGLIEALEERVRAGVPLLGICLGMQLLANSSEEGSSPGLGFIPATVRRINGRPTHRVPHLGWNRVHVTRKHVLFDCLEDDARFYFAHSYRLVCDSKSDVLGVTRYADDFASVVQRDNVIGVQFHPEKSHRYGQEVLGRFIRL